MHPSGWVGGYLQQLFKLTGVIGGESSQLDILYEGFNRKLFENILVYLLTSFSTGLFKGGYFTPKF